MPSPCQLLPARRPVLLFGATSILGFNLARSFAASIEPFVTPGSRAHAIRHWPELRLDNVAWLEQLFSARKPRILLYCHAICDVPKCEAAPEWAHEINVEHVRRVLAALPRETRLVYVSSDHVFSGDGVYDEDSFTCPISVYGRTRVKAEALALSRAGSLIIRVGLPIGISANGRTGHWDWLCYRMRRNLPVTIVRDEYRSAVWATDLARRVMLLAESAVTGVCHVSATRSVSRTELADYLLSLSRVAGVYQSESRHQRSAPHLGRVELASRYCSGLFAPLQSVIVSPAAHSLDNPIARNL